MFNAEVIRKEMAEQRDRYAGGKFDSYFKYCSDGEVLKSIFIDQKIRFTQPRVLNDPLEFNPTMRFNQPDTSYQVYDLNGLLFPSIELFYRVQIIESQINTYGILSLTKIPNSFDMWSQYANGHRGFVLEFKDSFWHHPCMKSRTGEEYTLGQVEYVEDYAINLDDLVDSQNKIPVDVLHKELFFKKTSRWSHEREYRLVRPLTDSPDYKPPESRYMYTDINVYSFPFNWECISSVILGPAMTTANKKLIVECCEKHNIPKFQACIIRDQKDWFGKPAAIYIMSLDQYESKSRALHIKPQVLCTDTIKLGTGKRVKITKITDLPYYKGYEEIVDELYRNLKTIVDA